MANPILTVGSLAFDSIETPKGKVDSVLGGSCNYFSIAASLLNPVDIVGVVGEDFPKDHLDWLGSRSVDVSGVEVAQGGKTFHWSGSYVEDLNEAKTLDTQLNVFETFSPKLSDAHKNAKYLFLANIDPSLQLDVVEQVESPDLIAMDSMNLWINIKKEELVKIIKKVDLLSINEGEAFLLSGSNNLTQAAEIIRDMGPRVVLIKRGEYGATCFTNNGIFFGPAYPTPNVTDPTGAGDSFAGAAMGYLASVGATRETVEDHIRPAVLAGCAMASFTVEDFSIHRLMRLEKPEFELRLEALKKMMQF